MIIAVVHDDNLVAVCTFFFFLCGELEMAATFSFFLFSWGERDVSWLFEWDLGEAWMSRAGFFHRIFSLPR